MEITTLHGTTVKIVKCIIHNLPPKAGANKFRSVSSFDGGYDHRVKTSRRLVILGITAIAITAIVAWQGLIPNASESTSPDAETQRPRGSANGFRNRIQRVGNPPETHLPTYTHRPTCPNQWSVTEKRDSGA